MSKILSSLQRVISNPEAMVSFTADGGDEHWPRWWRWLMVKGNKAFLIGNVCDTCDFFFERQEGANAKPEIGALKDALSGGMQELTQPALSTLEAIFPSGAYEVLLLRTLVSNVKLGSNLDYFANEQIENSGLNTFWGLPRHPKVTYYRADTLQIGQRESLFEFVVPMFPKTWLNQARINYFREELPRGACPTALAISILDVKTPSTSPKGDSSETHYCLAHYLLDGHHKVEAAAQTGKPISMICFLALDQGVSSPEQILTVLSALRSD